MDRPSAWFWNATRRTAVALVPTLARPDDEFAAGRLESQEYRLYLTMDRRDRQHACNITRKLLASRPDAPAVLVRAALLHDVGKAGKPYNPVHRMLAHLYTPGAMPTEPRYSGLRGAWQVKLHHHLYGATLIREAGGSEQVARLVELHHEPGGDQDAALLKALDDET
ncbi:MAG: HD domain-containing protein [Trueperaceae bacterium]